MFVAFKKTGIRVAILFLLCAPSILSAQKNFVRGTVADTLGKEKLHYAIAALVDLKDSSLYSSVRTDEGGAFGITAIAPGHYLLLLSYPRMADYLKEITITDTSKINLGNIAMELEATVLQEVVVKSGAAAIRMRGDTLEYLADSFAVKPGANVEELLKRLPGIRVEMNGKIYAQGKPVQKVYVDGDEFFSDDPGLASKYLNADAVEKVQVYDKKSDQSSFSGVDDGQRTKSINLVLKKDRNKGTFGKLSAGSDANKYYNFDAMTALFSGARKASVFGMASKVGNVEINGNELSQYVGQDYEPINDGSGNMVYTNNSYEYDGDSYYGGGIPSVLYGGAHYSDRWNSNKNKLFVNYRTRQVDVKTASRSTTLTTLPDSTSFYNASAGNTASHNFMQKGSGSVSFMVDSFSTIKVSVDANQSNGNRYNSQQSFSKNEKGIEVNNSNSSQSSHSDNKKFSGNLTYQRRFKKGDRTLSLSLQQLYNNGNTDDYNLAANRYYDASSGLPNRGDTLDQLQTSNTLHSDYAGKAVFSSLVVKNLHMSAEYGFKNAYSTNAFTTFNNSGNGYTKRIDSLSNDYHFTIQTYITGTTFSYHKNKLSLTAGGRVFFSRFIQLNNTSGDKSNRHFVNLAPQVNATLQINQKMNVSVNYTGQTAQPSVEQLQPLRRSRNPLYILIGNPNLKQSFSHNAGVNYSLFDWNKGISLYSYASVYFTDNIIVSKTEIDAQNRNVSQYVNTKGLPNYNGYISFGKEFKKLHLRPSLNLNVGSNSNYSILNGVMLKNKSSSISSGLSCSYDLQDKISASYDVNFSYNAGFYNSPERTVNRTWSHTHNIRAVYYLPKNWELASDANMQFQPRNKTFNSNFTLIRWNAYVQKKLLKNKTGFIKLSINDILNDNTGYHRYVYGNTISENDETVIKRYWLLTFGWNFSKTLK